MTDDIPPPSVNDPLAATPSHPRDGAPWLHAVFASAPYRLTLWAPPPRGLTPLAGRPWPGAPDVGALLTDGEFTFDGERHRLAAIYALPEDVSRPWLEKLHGFHWLNDLSVSSDPRARYQARIHIDGWLGRYQNYVPLPWRADILSERLINWIWNFEFLARGAPDAFERRLLGAIERQCRHLARVAGPRRDGAGRIHRAKALIFCACALPGKTRLLHRALKQLERGLALQVLADGGHVERNPERLLDVLRDCIDVRAVLLGAGQNVPAEVQGAIDRIAPMVRAMRHGDGGLALFNGAHEGARDAIDLLLAQADTRSQAPASAPHTGFQRLGAANTLVIMDTGAPSQDIGYDTHAGTLSFEMSSGKNRIVVNCGARNDASDPWHGALRATAAHSTLGLGGHDSSTFTPAGAVRRAARVTHCERRPSDEGILVEAAHDGYVEKFGLIHHRALFLAHDGLSLRGEDRLDPAAAPRDDGADLRAIAFDIRFHLHPTVQVSPVQGGHGVLLKIGRKEIWRMRANGAEVALEESVYLGREDGRKRSEQIVLRGKTSAAGALVKWAFIREA
ncbi:heparinase II/III family protein [Varunaivibrio sulfuroxidans]|uniref:Putative heparinase superfamily protein n=1 Tax=Varunaivibrio sulfuroxidans TaxID=1773489 RepID=A0A4R3JFZ5_9PROT|nr:heparinase II/III family protein [Varunaivibrio sulfuroxidans]TCS64824.1 putative heparinase superfamily protein [Varunaivibrio sulfuroxidans]WES29875.1 heparinase II/III family protein [Varunaivibrio sulfuroxidans]